MLPETLGNRPISESARGPEDAQTAVDRVGTAMKEVPVSDYGGGA